jgi:hypothetical protein
LSLERTPETPRRSGPEVAQTAVEFLAEGFGPFAAKLWPLSGVAVAVLGLLTLLKLARDWRAAPAGRLRALGLLGFGVAMLCLAVGIGLGRGSGFETRYATMAAPALCLAYFVGRDARRPVVAWGLFALMAAFLVPSTVVGIQRGENRRTYMRQLQADVARGMTPDELANKWADAIYGPGGEATVRERLEMLRRAGQGPYRGR